jgi:hypothetical protein
MVLTVVWISVIVALLALAIAWGGTIDRTSTAFTRTRRPPRPIRGARSGVAPAAPR